MSDYQCPSCGGFCKKSGCERKNVTPQSNGWAEYNALVDRILKGTSYSHIDDWLASRAALVGEVKPVAGLFRSTSSNVIECFYYSTLLPADSHTFPQEAIDVLPLGKTVPLYSAEAIAIAILAERERAAKLLAQTDLSKLPDEWKVFFAQLLNAYVKAIREGKE